MGFIVSNSAAQTISIHCIKNFVFGFMASLSRVHIYNGCITKASHLKICEDIAFSLLCNNNSEIIYNRLINGHNVES
jgi:hypothetical protein